MNENGPETLERLLRDLPVGPAPIEEMLVTGRARKTRRRRLSIAGVAAVAVLAVGGGAVAAQQAGGADERDRSKVFADDPGQTNPEVSDALGSDPRQVGIGQVAVSVPGAWSSQDPLAVCETTLSGAVIFPSTLFCNPPQVSSLAIRPEGLSNEDLYGWLDTYMVDGSEVTITPVECEDSNTGVTCTQQFGFEGLDAWFTATVHQDDGGRATLDAIRESLTVLPESQTTVPPVRARSAAAVGDAIRAAGLEAATVEEDCPPNAHCILGVTGISPSAGTVVERGSQVVVSVLR